MTLLDHYSALHEQAATGTLAARRQLAVSGRDRATYLHGLLTNDIAGLAPGQGCYAAWLTPQGRMLTDMHVLQSESMILLDVPAELADATLQRLDQFLFSEDVQLGALGDSLQPVWLHGPAAAAALGRAMDVPADLGEWPQYRHAQLTLGGQGVVVARIDQLGVPGFCVYGDPAAAAMLLEKLAAAGVPQAGAAALEAARGEAGYPLFGVDMTDDTIPLEAGIESRAISFTKGCYVGQEVIIRVMHRGHGRVARKLVGLAFEERLPARGARLFAGDRDIGWVTSTAESPRHGAIGMGYAQRDFVEPGTGLQVNVAGARAAVRVTARPLRSAS